MHSLLHTLVADNENIDSFRPQWFVYVWIGALFLCKASEWSWRCRDIFCAFKSGWGTYLLSRAT